MLMPQPTLTPLAVSGAHTVSSVFSYGRLGRAMLEADSAPTWPAALSSIQSKKKVSESCARHAKLAGCWQALGRGPRLRSA